MTKPGGDGLESHHMPAAAASQLPRTQGPAIQMDSLDHARTASNGRMAGSAQYRAEIADMLNNGNIRGAMAKEIRDVRRACARGIVKQVEIQHRNRRNVEVRKWHPRLWSLIGRFV